MGFLGGKSPPALPPVPEPVEDKEALEAAARAEEERLRKMKGRRSTILTGGGGVEEEAQVEKKTLLGQ